MGELKGKVAIVTGGGRGIGRSHAIWLANAGAAVVVNDLGGDMSGEGASNRGPADDVVAEIKAAGGQAVADTTDLSDYDRAKAVIDTAVKAFGRLDILLNNAAIFRLATIEHATKIDWDRTIAVNLTGTAATCHWAAVYWRTQGPEAGRRIINTSSGLGLAPPPNNPMYVAAKAGVAAITQSSAIELAELGVRVNALAPVARSRISEVMAGDLVKAPETGFDRWSPDNIAAVGVYLASPACRFTGRVIGIVGDQLTMWDGWTVGFHASNSEKPWTQAQLENVLGQIEIQQRGKTQAIFGTDPLVSPADAVLGTLAKIEKA